MQKIGIALAVVWLAVFSCAQNSALDGVSNPNGSEAKGNGGEKLEWLNISEAGVKLQAQKRPILIDMYTDWCGWCKVMDKKTYTNTELIKYVSEKFYPVKLDAETRETINWNGKQFKFRSDYKVNEFAVYLAGGELAFPTTVIIPTDGTPPQAIPGYLKPEEMELILKYFGEGYYGKTPFQEFQRQFKSSWK